MRLVAWTKAERALVVQLYEAGYSYSQIANELGKTRNAVAGVLLRIRTGKEQVSIAKPKPRLRASPKPKSEPMAKPRPTYKMRSVETAPQGAKELHELAALECRWAYGDGPFLFCGHPTNLKSSYCEKHHNIVYWRNTHES